MPGGEYSLARILFFSALLFVVVMCGLEASPGSPVSNAYNVVANTTAPTTNAPTQSPTRSPTRTPSKAPSVTTKSPTTGSPTTAAPVAG
jgi:hypothetical protein